MSKRAMTLVTSNPQKALEIAQALAPYDISIKHRNVDLPEIKSMDIAVIAADKATKAFNLVHGPVLVDDTGIFFKGYPNFPGAYSRLLFVALGFKGMFRLIKPGQAAEFCSVIAFKPDAKTKPIIFSGRCRGSLITQLRGKRKPKMPYDNFFIPVGERLTFSQMTVAGKQRYDHRSKAVRKFAKYYHSQA